MKYVLFFSECGEQDIEQVGRKATNLALLFKRGFKVPPGFIVSSNVFNILKQDKSLKKVIQDMFENKENAKSNFQEIFKKVEFPEEIEDEIVEAYLSLSVDLNMSASSLLETKEVFVAVRSSTIDSKNLFLNLSHKTVLNIKGKKKIFRAILDDYYHMILEAVSKHKNVGNINDLNLAIIIQNMVNSQKSGVACSINQETNEKETIVIKACFGLGEGLSSGSVFPDVYKLDKKTLSISEVEIAEKQYEFVKDIDSDETVKHRLGEKSLKQALDDQEIIEIARVLKKIVTTFEKELKIEWAIKNNVLYVLQMKDIKVKHKETVEMEILPEKEEKVPDIIDIADVDLDDDLQMLDEIEKYENQEEPEKEKINLKSEDIVSSDELDIKQEVDMPEYEIVQPELYDLNQEKVDEENLEENNEEELIEEEISGNSDEELEDEEVQAIDLFGDGDLDEDLEPSEEEQDGELEVEDEIVEEELEEPEETKKINEESIFENFDTFKVEEEVIEKPPMNNFTELAYLNAANTLMFCHMAIKDKLRQRLGKHVKEIPEDFSQILNELREYESVENEQDLKKINKVKEDYITNKKYPEPEDVALGLRLI